MDVGTLINKARQYVASEPSEGLLRRVQSDATKITKPSGDPDIAFWTYHVTGSPLASSFAQMIEHQKRMALKFHPNSVHFTVTGEALDMFERCVAMCAHVHSEAFSCPTVFLDSDAFPNGDLRIDHEIALTVRSTPGLMPVNEGVIFAGPGDHARQFFRSYLATYERLAKMLEPKDWRWWGGQLALNAHASPDNCWPLPCEIYNFSPDKPETRQTLDSKLVLHLKGGRKDLFDQVVKYQESR